MSDPTFSMIDDRTGETKDATVKDVSDYQAKGYRVADPAAYHAARNAAVDPTPEPEPAPGEDAMRAKVTTDAAELAAAQEPDAKPLPADKKTPKQTVA